MGKAPEIESIVFTARLYGWVQVPHRDMLSFRRKKSRINIWFDKFGTLTVSTALEHPRLGKTQLYRRRVSGKMLEVIFENPRVHTKLGYMKKKPTNSGRWK